MSDASNIAAVKPLVWEEGGNGEGFLSTRDGHYIFRDGKDALLNVRWHPNKMFSGADAEYLAKEYAQALHDDYTLSAITLKSEADICARERAKVLGEVMAHFNEYAGPSWFNDLTIEEKLHALHTPESRKIALDAQE